MCQHKSAIITYSPRSKGKFEIIHSPCTDSHSELIRAYGLKDDGKLRFARVEFSPPDMSKAAEVDTYKLRLDEERAPDWWSDDMAAAVAEKMRGIVSAMIVKEDDKYLLGGAWIVPKGLTVSVGPMTRVVANLGTVSENYGTVSVNYSGGTVSENCSCGTVSGNYGTVSKNRGTVSVNHSCGTIVKQY